MSEPRTERAGSPWRPTEAPPPEQRAAFHRLATAIRTTISLMMDSNAPAAELDAASATLEAFNAQLAAGPRDRPLWGYAEPATSGDTGAFYDSSPLSGPANPLAPPMTLRVDGDEVFGTAVFGLAYEGPPGHVHGGFVAAAFDELLGLVQSSTGNPGMTGTLVVRYRRPTPLHQELTFRGRVERTEGRKIFTTATLHAGETLCAEAEGIFIAVGNEHFRAMAEQHRLPPA
jgi:acyl-coenzyme A thioesterase PaaI-like protein